MLRYWLMSIAPVLGLLVSIAASNGEEPKEKPKTEAAEEGAKWQSLLSGKDLKGWKKTDFGGEGEVTAEEGETTIEIGKPLSGITYQEKPPYKMNYELRFEAKRIKGGDFFACVTFPVGDSYCSFVPGGWGGAITGLSSINNFDAAENSTSTYVKFDNDKWYKFVIRVTPKAIECFVDGKQVVEQELKDVRVSTRLEMDSSQPLGIATYDSAGVVRNFAIRSLEKEKESKPTGEEKK